FDFVLIDSRTGLTDSGGICTIQMPDVLVLVITATRQGVEGAQLMAERARRGRRRLAYARLALPVVPLLSRWDGQAEEVEGAAWMDRIEKAMSPYVDTWVSREMPHRRVLESLRVPHSPYFSFGEKLPVLLQESLSDPEKPARTYLNLSALLLKRDWS